MWELRDINGSETALSRADRSQIRNNLSQIIATRLGGIIDDGTKLTGLVGL
ncbi:MAG: hypothetical protein K6G88_06815 [Lachnospiraceae bacterium]|nr:hypothetical protein [Lachnospiraceae bacterium]